MVYGNTSMLRFLDAAALEFTVVQRLRRLHKEAISGPCRKLSAVMVEGYIRGQTKTRDS